MQNDSVNLIITLLVVLAVVFVLFMILDRFLKGGTKKPAEKTTVKMEDGEKKIEVKEPLVENKVLPSMHIYNSELADDLNEMLKNSNSTESTRLKMEKHLDRESHITKYIQSKNYHNSDFENEEVVTSEDKNESLTFTRDDYKRFMALSNIDEDKPL